MITDEGLVDSPELGIKLGVSTNQVYMWHKRRARNGFPEAVAMKPHGTRRDRDARAKFLWRLEDVIEWRKQYKPSKGGAGTHKHSVTA